MRRALLSLGTLAAVAACGERRDPALVELAGELRALRLAMGQRELPAPATGDAAVLAQRLAKLELQLQAQHEQQRVALLGAGRGPAEPERGDEATRRAHPELPAGDDGGPVWSLALTATVASTVPAVPHRAEGGTTAILGRGETGTATVTTPGVPQLP